MKASAKAFEFPRADANHSGSVSPEPPIEVGNLLASEHHLSSQKEELRPKKYERELLRQCLGRPPMAAGKF
jgi:hypothetical protein